MAGFSLGLGSLSNIGKDLGANVSNIASSAKTVLSATPPFSLYRKAQSINPNNWNLSLPYFFTVSTANEQGIVTSLTDNPFNQYFNTNQILFYIPPSGISISTPYAVSVVATNGGILEEFNGLVFRNISISGTTGLFPTKSNRGAKPGGALGSLQDLGNALAPGLTTAIGGVVNSVAKTIKSVTGDTDPAKDIQSDLTANPEKLFRTGYYQFWQLNNFLLAYTEFKKQVKSAQNARLIFGSPKDNIAYVVTPISFELKRDVSNPLLYHYHIVLKGWDIVPATIQAQPINVDIPTPDAVSVLKSVTNVITSAQNVISSAEGVLAGINSDLFSILNVYNQGVVFLNSATGLANSVSNFKTVFSNPNNLSKMLSSSPTNRSLMQSAITSPSETNVPPGATTIAQGINNFTTASNNPSGATSATVAGAGGSISTAKTTPGGEDKNTSTSSISNQAASAGTIALNTNSFASLSLNQLDIPASVQAQIDAQISAAQQLTAGQIRTLTDNLKRVNDNYAISLNMMDAVYAATYNIPFVPATSGIAITIDDILTAIALEEGRYSFISLLATGQIFKEREPDPFLLANQAIPSDNQLNTPQSQISVPFQRGATLETMAQFYLGDANRSREIAILNNLRAPYIDEAGFDIPIVSASGRTFIINTNTNVAINQKITINATGRLSTKRTILNVEHLGNSHYRITVDGDPNLDVYIPSTHPLMHARIPGTVGSGDTILIPSTNPPSDVYSVRPTPLFNALPNTQKLFKVDMALDQTGRDLSVGPNGDVILSFGYNNAQQAIRLAVEVEQQELEQHPDYGLPITIGSRTSDVTMQDVEHALSLAITKDSRFVSADVTAVLNGNMVNVNINAFGAQGSGEIPVSFDIGLV